MTKKHIGTGMVLLVAAWLMIACSSAPQAGQSASGAAASPAGAPALGSPEAQTSTPPPGLSVEVELPTSTPTSTTPPSGSSVPTSTPPSAPNVPVQPPTDTDTSDDTDTSNKVVVRLPPAIPPALFNQLSSFLDKLSPHESHESGPNEAEIATGAGTVALAAIALATVVVAWFQFLQERTARREERVAQQEAREHDQMLRDDAQMARHAEAFASVSQRWNDKPFREVRKKIRSYNVQLGAAGFTRKMEDLRKALDDEFFDLLTAMDYFEDLGTLVKYQAISLDMVETSLGTTVCQYWKIFEPFINLQRKDPQDPKHEPTYYTEFEKLAADITKRKESRKAQVKAV